MSTQSQLAPVRFLIEAVSPEPQAPEHENYVIQSQLNNGHWTSRRAEHGIQEVRNFLAAMGVDANAINLAAEELRRVRKTDVSV